MFRSSLFLPVCFLLLPALTGCGTAIQRNGTEQLLLSDSVDRAIDQLDLSPLAGRRIFLDTTYMQTFKGNNMHVNSDYIVSGLRQKLTTTGCQIEVNRTEADYIIEARIGALGTDTMEVTYGIPSSGSGLGAAATALSGAPSVISIPEVSMGKRNGAIGVSKVVVFAYHRESGVPVWQSGAAVARSDAKDSWFMGVGPLTRGSVYDGPMLAGNRINPPFEKKNKQPRVQPLTIGAKHNYVHPAVLEKQLAEAKEQEAVKAKQAKADADKSGSASVQQVSHENTQTADAASGTPGSESPSTVVPAVPIVAPAPVPVPAASNGSGADPTDGSSKDAGRAVMPSSGGDASSDFNAGRAVLPPAVPPANE